MRTILLLMAALLLVANVGVAGDCGPACCDQACDACDSCGVKKVCKTVCEMKKVKRTVWVVECEEFCAPLPNCDRGCDRCCNRCGTGCCEGKASCCGAADDCGSCCKDPCESLTNRKYVPPKCGKVRTRKKLVKKEIVCEVPVYKCVVVCSDPGCCEAASGCLDEEASKAAPAPAPAEETTDAAPLPPLLGTLYLNSHRVGR